MKPLVKRCKRGWRARVCQFSRKSKKCANSKRKEHSDKLASNKRYSISSSLKQGLVEFFRHRHALVLGIFEVDVFGFGVDIMSQIVELAFILL